VNELRIVVDRNPNGSEFQIQAWIVGDAAVPVRGIGRTVREAIADLFTAGPTVDQARALERSIAAFNSEVA
jgi:hypothetical protein